MNLRLSVIVLSASLFMAIWDADQRAIQQNVLASRNAAGKPLAAAVSTAKVAQTAGPVAAPIVRTSIPAEGLALPPVEESIPLPANLAAGTWTGLSDDGRRTVITVHETPAAAENHFCIIHSVSGRRWCFVRSTEERAAAGSAAERQ
ncbi:MAG: hypothetical protein ACKOEO_08240 [Planctomycetaceae bacterium]